MQAFHPCSLPGSDGFGNGAQPCSYPKTVAPNQLLPVTGAPCRDGTALWDAQHGTGFAMAKLRDADEVTPHVWAPTAFSSENGSEENWNLGDLCLAPRLSSLIIRQLSECLLVIQHLLGTPPPSGSLS